MDAKPTNSARKILSLAAMMLAGTLISTNSSAIQIVGGSFDGTDVGSLDTILGQTGILGSPASEESWAEGILGGDLDFSDATKTEDVPWYETNTINVIAFQLLQGSGYYVVKNSTTTVLFENLDDLSWGVITKLDALNLGDDMEISHVTENATTNPPSPPAPGVPIPAPLALLGLGGLMLGWITRKSRA